MTPGLRGVLDNVAATDPTELQALLSQTVAQLFGNARDDKVRRVFELTYFQPALKQEAVAERLALSFGTYRRHLTAGRERLAWWLWERSRLVTAEAEASRGGRRPFPVGRTILPTGVNGAFDDRIDTRPAGDARSGQYPGEYSRG